MTSEFHRQAEDVGQHRQHRDADLVLQIFKAQVKQAGIAAEFAN